MQKSDLASVRAAILGALGLGAGSVAVGCGAKVVLEEDGAGGAGTTTQTATSGTSGQTGSVTTATIATVATGVTTGGGCSTPISAVAIQPPVDGPCGGFFGAQYICFPKVPDGPACTALYSEACVLEAYSCGFQEVGNASCPDPGAAQCCFTVVGDCPVGRPFMVGGVARLAAAERNAGWAARPHDSEVVPGVDELDAPTREALAAFWTREALTEHASVASFSRFVLQLLALGAPADLVKAATQATADEVEHARIAFSFASAYGGLPVGPTELDVSGALDGVLDRTAAAVSIASEGCVAETVSALQIALAADEATDPAVRAALHRIADEEMQHAQLAWRALAWLLETGGPAMQTAVGRVFDDAAAHVGLGPVVDVPGDADRMRAHGYLPLEERRRRATEVLATIVGPCARSLLQGVLCQLASPSSQATKNSVAVLPSEPATSSPSTP
ncbi:MAG: hypothetical protein HOV80_33485 [Polyangiaceae bacterium]|nr:hypothetical protein [Polyangiaceae bacterium]